MDTSRVPSTVQGRLGPEATAGLVDLLNDARKEWTAEVIGIVGDRFERRLVEETSKLRVEMAHGFAAVRQEMAQGLSAVRQEMAQGLSAVRQEMATGFGAVRQEIADQRFDLLKWAFLFWVGQVFAVASLVAVVIRFLRAGA